MTTTPTLWAGPIAVSSDPTSQQSSITALAEGGYVVAFDRAGVGGTARDLVGLKFTETGSVVNVNLLATPSADVKAVTGPEIVQLTNGSLATGYSLSYAPGDGDIYAAINAPVTLNHQLIQVVDADGSSSNDVLVLDIEATADGGFAMLWLRNGTTVILNKLSAIGQVTLNDVSLASSSSLATGDITSLKNGSLVAAVLSEGSIYFRTISAGNSVGGSVFMGVADAIDLVIDTLPNGNLVAAWRIENGSVSTRVFTPGFVALTDQIRITDTGADPKLTVLADGGFLVGYSGTGIGVQRFSANGDRIGTPALIDQAGIETLEDMQTLSDGRVVVTYRGETGAGTGVFAVKSVILDPREANLVGTDASEAIVGRLGDTTISAGDGNDRVTGMGGDDQLNGQSGDDVLNGGAGDDDLKGGSGTDSLNGGSGADQLFGGSGSDLITGGSGRDVLWGQSGNDVFRFLLASESGTTTATQDIIRDFIQTEDKIDLAGIDAKLGAAGNEAFVFIGGAVFSAEGQVRAVTVGGFTRVEMNTTGSSGLEGAILVEGVIAFTSSDFIL